MRWLDVGGIALLTERRTTTVESAIAFGWEILQRCRTRIDVAESTVVKFPFGRTVGWDPTDISHGDLGVAMVYSAADFFDPDGGWDRLAHGHLAKAARGIQRAPLLTLGLFADAVALAFTLRAHSRSGERYQRVTSNLDAQIARQLDVVVERVELEVGSASELYDVVSGLAGAVTYAFTTDAGSGALGDGALQAVNMLAELALTDHPGGLWTPPDKLHGSERAGQKRLSASQLNCGFAHGIAGVLNVLGQAADRGWGSLLVPEAAERLAAVLLEASDAAGVLDVPELFPAEGSRPAPRSRYAWCQGNLGSALPFHNSRTLRRKHPDVVARLLDTSSRTEDDLRLGGSSLCHGRAGRLLLERTMLGEHTVTDNAESLLKLADPSRAFLLADSVGIDLPGFLVGSGGAGAALIALQTDCDALPFTRMLTGTWLH